MGTLSYKKQKSTPEWMLVLDFTFFGDLWITTSKSVKKLGGFSIEIKTKIRYHIFIT